MGPVVYVSTGAAREATAASWASALLGLANLPLELSGGAHSSRVREELAELADATPLMLHNYFPPPESPFVLNLASDNAEIALLSRQMVEQALELSASVGASHYAVHSGYCFDPAVDSLGRPLVGQMSGQREAAFDRLVSNVTALSQRAAEIGVRLLVENHVLSAFNLEKFGENPLLLTEPAEIRQFFDIVGGSSGLLLDVGHLKVSSRTLGFDLTAAMSELLPLAEGFHLSENDGGSDQHLGFTSQAWFLPYLRDRDDFMTVEIHSTRLQDSIDAARATIDYLTAGSQHG